MKVNKLAKTLQKMAGEGPCAPGSGLRGPPPPKAINKAAAASSSGLQLQTLGPHAYLCLSCGNVVPTSGLSFFPRSSPRATTAAPPAVKGESIMRTSSALDLFFLVDACVLHGRMPGFGDILPPPPPVLPKCGSKLKQNMHVDACQFNGIAWLSFSRKRTWTMTFTEEY